MTPEQKERIRAAARELGAALSAVGDSFTIDADIVDVTTMGDERRKYVYSVTVEAVTREIIR